MKTTFVICTLTFFAQAPFMFGASLGYEQVNLVSDIPGMAQNTDPNLQNPWGMSFSATSPFWVSNAAGNTTTLYNGAGVPNSAIVVTVPGGPTGQVNNSAGAGNFPVSGGNGLASNFIFDTLSGTINAWNGSLGAMGTAATVVTTPGAVYTGLAITPAGSSTPRLYAANFTIGGGINVFNSSFTQVAVSGGFVDPTLPAGYAPYNIQLIGNNLYVEYAEVGSTPGTATRGAGLGFVAVYDLNGNLLQHLVSNGALNAPWGVTMAPAGFGQYSLDLLVGNFGDGTINVFDPNTGAQLGTLDDSNGNPIVNQDLWALDFRVGGAAGSMPDDLYFDAGINRQKDGLFGLIEPVPEPSVYGLGLFGLALIGGLVFRSRRKANA